MKGKLVVLLLISLLVLSGCVQLPTGAPDEGISEPTVIPIAPTPTPEPMPTPKIEDLQDLDLVETVPESKRLKVEVVYSGIDSKLGFSYFGAYTMLVKYLDPNSDLSETIAASGLGVDAVYVAKNKTLFNGKGTGAIADSSGQLGFEYYLGVKRDSVNGDILAGLEENAKQVTYLETEEEAVLLLKKLIASEIPVVVHLDAYYAKDYFTAVSAVWASAFQAEPEKHIGHYVTVTGYDLENVYVNDPEESHLTKAKDVRIPWENFLPAWQHGNLFEAEERAHTGSYWMLFLSPTRKQAKDRKEIVAFNKQLAEANGTTHAIRQFAEAPPNVQAINCVDMAKARQEFNLYLKSHGFRDAGEKFQQSGMAFERLCDSPSQMKDLQFIADVEASGLKLLR